MAVTLEDLYGTQSRYRLPSSPLDTQHPGTLLAKSIEQLPYMYLMLQHQKAEQAKEDTLLGLKVEESKRQDKLLGFKEEEINQKWDIAKLNANYSLYDDLIKMDAGIAADVMDANSVDLRTDDAKQHVSSTSAILREKVVPLQHNWATAKSKLSDGPQTKEEWDEIKDLTDGYREAEDWYETTAAPARLKWITNKANTEEITNIYRAHLKDPGNITKLDTMAGKAHISASTHLNLAESLVQGELRSGKQTRQDLATAINTLTNLQVSKGTDGHYQYVLGQLDNDANAAAIYIQQEVQNIQNSLDFANTQLLNLASETIGLSPVDNPPPPPAAAAAGGGGAGGGAGGAGGAGIPAPAATVVDTAITGGRGTGGGTRGYQDRRQVGLIPEPATKPEQVVTKYVPPRPRSSDMKEASNLLTNSKDKTALNALISKASRAYKKIGTWGQKPDARTVAEDKYLAEYRNMLEFKLSKGIQRDLKGNLLTADDWANATPEEQEKIIQLFLTNLSK